MSEHIGGKGSGASSSSEFLRAYRTGVLAGANASYQTIPKKAAKSYATTTDLLEARNQRGVLADLSSILVTESTCPVDHVGPHTPLEYVSTNLIATLSAGNNGIAHINRGVQYVTTPANNSLYSVGPYQQILTGLSSPTGIIQSLLDENVYITNAGNGSLISRRIGGLSYSTVVPSGLTGATDITQDNIGNFYISGPSIIKVTPSAEVSSISPLSSTGIAYATDGNLYATTPASGVYRLDVSGSGNRIYSTTSPLYGITQANDGNIYICGPSSIIRMNLSGEQATTFAPFPGGAYGITQGADENFYVTATSGNVYQIVVR